MTEQHIPVRALVWLRIDADGDVRAAELVADTSWMEPFPRFTPFFDSDGDGDGPPLSAAAAAATIDSLTERSRWENVELSLEV